MMIMHAEKGFVAKCDCGWTSRSYTVPDNAYGEGMKHKCKDKK